MTENKEVDYRFLYELLDDAELKAKENLFAVENSTSVSLADVIREKRDTVEFLLAYFKKQGGSGYKMLSDLMSQSGIKVSDGVLTTTIARVRKSRVTKSNAGEVSSAVSKPVTVTNPVAMTKKVVAAVAPVGDSLLGAVPGDDDVIEWDSEKARLAVGFKVGFVGDEWTADDDRVLKCLVSLAREHGLELTKLASADVMSKIANDVCSFQLSKARKLNKLPK
ncbi:MAG: hypothetical protein C4294_18470 [Nitrospiraceae bacterium]